MDNMTSYDAVEYIEIVGPEGQVYLTHREPGVVIEMHNKGKKLVVCIGDVLDTTSETNVNHKEWVRSMLFNDNETSLLDLFNRLPFNIMADYDGYCVSWDTEDGRFIEAYAEGVKFEVWEDHHLVGEAALSAEEILTKYV